MNVKIVKGERCEIDESVILGAWPFVLEKKFRLNSSTIVRRRREILDGSIVIGDEVSIGALTVIQMGRTRPTQIGDNVHINQQCGIGHDVKIGPRTIIGMGVKISGYAEIGADCVIDPDVYITNRVRIGEGSRIRIGSLVIKNVPPESDMIGRPAEPFEDWRKWRKARRDLIESFT